MTPGRETARRACCRLGETGAGGGAPRAHPVCDHRGLERQALLLVVHHLVEPLGRRERPQEELRGALLPQPLELELLALRRHRNLLHHPGAPGLDVHGAALVVEAVGRLGERAHLGEAEGVEGAAGAPAKEDRREAAVADGPGAVERGVSEDRREACGRLGARGGGAEGV